MNDINSHIGSSFDEWLDEENILIEVSKIALARVLNWRLQQQTTKNKQEKDDRDGLNSHFDADYSFLKYTQSDNLYVVSGSGKSIRLHSTSILSLGIEAITSVATHSIDSCSSSVNSPSK